MDFKVCGTEKGITAIQMDIKIDGLSQTIMEEALEQARAGRLHILNEMNKCLPAPREELSKYAPRITAIKVKPDQIRTIIGPGGKMIKAITEQTGAQINVSDDGTVSISSSDPEAVKKAIAFIEGLTTSPEVGAKYKGTVRRVERYGAFIEIAPGKDGLLHITDMSYEFVNKVEDIMNLGDEVEVVVSNIDREGRVKLSRKPLLEKPEGYVEPEPREPRERSGGDRGGGRDGGRGGRDGGRGGRDGGRGGRDGGRDGGRGGRDGGRDRAPRREASSEGGAAPAAAAATAPREDGDRPRRRRRRREGGEGEGGTTPPTTTEA
jgi:polyribonucleotide nucleotidyltransferase